MHRKQIIECVPNFSEGRNTKVLNAIADAIRKVNEVKLLHLDQGEAANRTVFTFAGTPNAVIEAAFQAIKTATQLIDMRYHKGEHPRIGATDVCPLVPIANINMGEVKKYANQLGERVGTELDIPVYLYEHSAKTTIRKNLATIRSGEYEGLEAKMQLPDWQPDYGNFFNAKTGGTVIGARDFLIAYNINLNTNSVEIANMIAKAIRESGKLITKKNGEKTRILGKCKSLKALGWYIKEYGKAQVSINLTNYRITGIHHAFEACSSVAADFDVKVTGSELIGLIPLSAMLDAGNFYLKKEDKKISQDEKEIIQTAVKYLGLEELAPFNFKERIIEYLL